MTMSKVIRVKPHLTLEDIDARLKKLHDFWRLRRWLVIRHALVDPAPAKDIACRLGLSVCPEEYSHTTSAGKRLGTSGKKIGNAHLKWAFAEAATLFLRNNPAGQRSLARL